MHAGDGVMMSPTRVRAAASPTATTRLRKSFGVTIPPTRGAPPPSERTTSAAPPLRDAACLAAATTVASASTVESGGAVARRSSPAVRCPPARLRSSKCEIASCRHFATSSRPTTDSVESTTGRWRKRPSTISITAVSAGSSSITQRGFSVMMAEILVRRGSRPAPSTRDAKSRSVKMPATRSSSPSTSAASALAAAIRFAASATETLPSSVTAARGRSSSTVRTGLFTRAPCSSASVGGTYCVSAADARDGGFGMPLPSKTACLALFSMSAISAARAAPSSGICKW
mmetsp:Transcript_25003/g.73086  ORF Transcript_25003/g.73086 Transcript_25003/m.73086 type:complete len:287 (-) Transcript_25003:33-893(-)